MKKATKVSLVAALAVSALTPAMAIGAETNHAAPGFYNVDTGTVVSADAFVLLSNTEKVNLLKNSNVYYADGQGKVVQATKIIDSKTDAALVAALFPETELEADKNVSLTPEGTVVPGQTAELKVESVKAINATHAEVKFSTAVDVSDAADANNGGAVGNLAKYSIGTNNPTDVVLSEDGKTATLTFAASVEGENVAVVVDPITTKADDNVKTERYASTLTYKDTAKPEVSKVESVTGGDYATSATVTFSEPVAAFGTTTKVKLNGVEVTSSDYTLAADGLTLTLNNQNMDSTAVQTLEIVNLKDKATTANTTSLITKTFNVTVDQALPSVTSIAPKSDTALVFTFSKAVALTGVQASTALQLIDEDIADKTTALIGTNNFTAVAGSNGTKWEVALESVGANALFTTTKKSHDVIVKVKNNIIADALGNKIAADNKTVTVKKDEVAPALTTANVRKDATGKVKELVFTFDEDITLTTTTALTDLLANTSVNVDNSVAGTLAAAFGGTLPAGTFTVKDNVITFALTTATAYSGKYKFEVAASKLTDNSLATNPNLAHDFTLDFGAALADETFKVVPASTTASGRVITVTFDTAVKGGAGSGSATLLSAYKLNGQALPTGTTITLDGTQKIATITLPTGTIETTDAAAIFIADSIVSKDGTKNLEKYTGTVAIDDNVAPELKTAVLTADNDLVISFSEAVTGATIGDFDIVVNGTTVASPTKSDGSTGITMALAPGAGSDTGKYVINLSDLIEFDSTNTVVNLTNKAGGDVLIATSDVTPTYKYSNSTAITSIKLVVKAGTRTAKDAKNNTLKPGTVITVK